MILSESVIHEYKTVANRISIKFPNNDAKEFLNTLIANAMIIDTMGIITPSCEDPDDIKFLEAAIAGKAKFLISGDKHLLDVGKYDGGVVIRPKEFSILQQN